MYIQYGPVNASRLMSFSATSLTAHAGRICALVLLAEPTPAQHVGEDTYFNLVELYNSYIYRRYICRLSPAIYTQPGLVCLADVHILLLPLA